MTKLTMDGREFVLVPEEAYDGIVARLGGMLPPLPPRDKNGNRPAQETILTMIARDVIRRRVAAGWTQEQLAMEAGVGINAVSRLETALQRAKTAVVEKIEEAFKKAGV